MEYFSFHINPIQYPQPTVHSLDQLWQQNDQNTPPEDGLNFIHQILATTTTLQTKAKQKIFLTKKFRVEQPYLENECEPTELWGPFTFVSLICGCNNNTFRVKI